jgi:ABC-2 type transport system permease protein
MNKTFIVLKHEFMLKLRSKGFIIMTLIGPLLMSLVFVIPILFQTMNKGDTRRLSVVDSTGKLAERMVARSLDTSGSFISRKLKTDAILDIALPGPTTQDSLATLVDQKILAGFMVIPAKAVQDSASTALIKLHTVTDFKTNRYLEDLYRDAVRDAKLESKGIDPALVANIDEGVDVETIKLTEKSESKESGGTGVAIAFITAFILYISMAMYGAIIMNSVVEEKSSRVVEIVASSIRPYQLLVGKVLGVASAGLLQIGVWTLMLVLLTTVGLSSASAYLGKDILSSVSPALFLYFMLFFVLGFLIYATLYAAVGSTAESASDVQQVAFPITMLLVIPFILLQGVISDPSSTASVVLSMVPFFAPILMLGRKFTETPPWWQIVLTVAIMIGTFFGCLWVAARIYRVGILMYGKKFKLGEVVKWIRYT